MNYENEKYSYIIFSKGEVGMKRPVKSVNDESGDKFSRLVRQPIKRGGHVVIDACTTQVQISYCQVQSDY